MSKQIKKRNIKQKKKIHESPFGIYWEKKNYIFLFLGFFLLIAGYFFMSVNPWNSVSALIISPVILVIAYVLIFPASILYTKKDKNKQKNGEEIINPPGEN